MKQLLDLRDLTERDWASQVADLARQLGWWRYHTYRSDRSQPGFPDETLIRDRVVFLELKTETGKVSPAQHDCLSRLIRAEAEAYIVRPRDLEPLASLLSLRLRGTHSAGDFYGRNTLTLQTRAELGLPPALPP